MKRVRLILLSLILVIGMVPVSAFADDTLGGIVITGGQSGTDYTLVDGCLTIQSPVPLTVSGSEASFRIVVAGSTTANLTLSDAAIDRSSATDPAIDLENGAVLNLTVSGNNTLKGGEKCAGISVPAGTTLSIDGSGELSVFGGEYAAGIGGGATMHPDADLSTWKGQYTFYGEDAGSIIISGGTVNVTGGRYGAGIGGGAGTTAKIGDQGGGNGATITISGGTVNAKAGKAGIHEMLGDFSGGAGIGGGGATEYVDGGSGGNITITGGIVNADSLNISDYDPAGGGAAIGSSTGGDVGTINISGGTIHAKAGGNGAGIGGGRDNSGEGVINISGGEVTAEGGKGAAGIGSGWGIHADGNNVVKIIISGGRVNAAGADSFIHPTMGDFGPSAAIGEGQLGSGSDVTISGGVVTAISGEIVTYYYYGEVGAAIGKGDESRGTHRFSTGENGSAVIITKRKGTTASEYITDLSGESGWQGTIFQGSTGQVYGDQTITDDFTIDADQYLTIPDSVSFTIAEGVTVTNNGTIENNGVSRNNGTIAGTGTIICNNHNWDEATLEDPKTCAFCKKTEGEHLPWVFSISAAPETVSFGSLQKGYTQPEAQTITVTNTGNRSVTIELPMLENYLITAGTGFDGTTAEISPDGGTAQFTVQPNASLETGTYAGTIDITGSDGVTASVETAFEVVEVQKAAKPVFSLAEGSYTGTQKVTISCSTKGAAIRYTVDGSEPTENSEIYTGEITVSETLTLKAKAFKDGMTASSAASATYTIAAAPQWKEYEITKGNGGIWTKDSENGLSFTADADYNRFVSVSVDGSVISEDHYTSKAGSTIIMLKASYLKTLSEGTHTLKINFTDGYAEAKFTVKAAVSAAPINSGTPISSGTPATGEDAHPWLWLCIALIAGIGLAGRTCMRCRRKW